MGNLKEQAVWEGNVYQLELTDPVVGGEDGISNRQAKQLANRTAWLKEQQEKMAGTVESFDPSMQAGLFAGLLQALDLAGLAMHEHEMTRKARFQSLTATIKNRGVKSGVAITKSQTATRNISASDGIVFMRGRQYPVADQKNTASIASNTGDKAGVVIIYMFLTAAGAIDVAATTLGGAMPEGAIELARATVPAGNTEENDPYLAKVVITDSARREAGWPSIQRSPASVLVPLNCVLPDACYTVAVEAVGNMGGSTQMGDLYVDNRLTNGFRLFTSGTADDVQVRLLVQHPGI